MNRIAPRRTSDPSEPSRLFVGNSLFQGQFSWTTSAQSRTLGNWWLFPWLKWTEENISLAVNDRQNQKNSQYMLTFESWAGKLFYSTIAVLFFNPCISSASVPFPSQQIFLLPIDSSHIQNFRNAVILRHHLAQRCNLHEGKLEIIIKSLIHVDYQNY